MELCEAVSIRIKELCKERNITYYHLNKLTGVPRTTIHYLVTAHYEKLSLNSIYELCFGFGMSLTDFFNSSLFSVENLTD